MTRLKLNKANVQRQLLKNGFTIAGAGKKAGLAIGTLYDLMSGKRTPRPNTVKKLADALNCDVLELATIDETPTTKGA